MPNRIRLFALTLFALPSIALAQAPVATGFRNDATDKAKNLIAAAETMPADGYAFKPTPAQMTFAQVVLHLAQGNDVLCSAIGGVKAPVRSKIADTTNKELLVARLLIESGADVRYVGTACPRTPWSDADREWLEAKGVQVRFRASLENDLDALAEFTPDLAIGTTPVVQAAKERTIPALYFTNLISARPLMGPAGAGSLATVVNAALGNKRRFDEMQSFFAGVGEGFAAGVWQEMPTDHPEFREHYKRQLAKAQKKRKAEEMV